jgi:hypothetical protein
MGIGALTSLFPASSGLLMYAAAHPPQAVCPTMATTSCRVVPSARPTSQEDDRKEKRMTRRYYQLPDRSDHVVSSTTEILSSSSSPLSTSKSLDPPTPHQPRPLSHPHLKTRNSEKLTVPNPQKAHRILQNRLGTIVPRLVLIGDVPVDEDLTGFPA